MFQIRRLRAEGDSIGDLADRFGVTDYNIKAIVYRRSWRHLPCHRGAFDPLPSRD